MIPETSIGPSSPGPLDNLNGCRRSDFCNRVLLRARTEKGKVPSSPGTRTEKGKVGITSGGLDGRRVGMMSREGSRGTKREKEEVGMRSDGKGVGIEEKGRGI
ncbi:hypothetical protein CBR_g52436 [Chara braunii]|uniref:Uncharacterized protein n=1 Tax=Chara braunii TaxID=69332 RepID=A0A388MA79_CHABU|nr:hypothetical protein CBR_g52436 [Chara braunii]|eukprot:GBG91481.1 hypothetical protein CBR_g52436 [Chara braunii]